MVKILYFLNNLSVYKLILIKNNTSPGLSHGMGLWGMLGIASMTPSTIEGRD